MKPGYNPNSRGQPYIALTNTTTITSTSYAFTEAFSPGTCVQASLLVEVTLGAGVTSLDLKLQQCLSSDPAAKWWDLPLADVANATTVAGEFLVPMAPYVFSFVTTGQLIGSIPVPIMLPFFRVAYKVTGVGAASANIFIAMTNL